MSRPMSERAPDITVEADGRRHRLGIMINHPAPGTAGSTAAAGVGGSESDAAAATVTDRDRDRYRDLPLAVGRASDYLRDRRRTVIMTAGQNSC